MTHARKPAPCRKALPAAALAALLLAGCSSGHIGESWQCPLAEGGTCDSVAAADPAVPDPKAAGPIALREPLWTVRDDGQAAQTDAAPPCSAACEGGFDPFGWIARLFGGAASAASTEDARADGREAGTTGATTAGPASTRKTPKPELPRAPVRTETAHDAAGDDLRTDEVVARIWIAPFVDADGVYREASHVRVVLEPAGWRLP